MSTRGRCDVLLPEDDAQAVTLVRAVEESDRAGRLLPLAERRAATARAREAGGSDDAWLAARARELTVGLGREHAFLSRFLRFTSPVRGLLPPALLLAFVLGLATNALGPEKRINVLALPLLGLIAWNLAVLALTAMRAWLPLPSALAGSTPRFVRRLEAMGRRLIDRLPRAGGGEADALRPALESYLARWLPAVTPLASARGRRLLHASSLTLILGIVAGMYLRGIAFQYHATWESTFLDGAAVDRFLGALLAPAAALMGTEVPSAAAIESPTYGDAAPWIHLWALTAGLFVGLPRSALAALEALRCARRRRRVAVSLSEGYLRRLLASVDTARRRIEVIPFSYRPPSAAAEVLKRLLYDLFGPRSEIRLRPSLEYGFEPEGLEPGDSRLRAVLFGLAQTPEVEVHGELMRRFQGELADGQALSVLVDAAAYRRRLAGGGRVEERLAERRRAWDRVVRDAGLTAVHLDLSGPLGDAASTAVVAAAWPPGALDEGA